MPPLAPRTRAVHAPTGWSGRIELTLLRSEPTEETNPHEQSRRLCKRLPIRSVIDQECVVRPDIYLDGKQISKKKGCLLLPKNEIWIRIINRHASPLISVDLLDSRCLARYAVGYSHVFTRLRRVRRCRIAQTLLFISSQAWKQIVK